MIRREVAGAQGQAAQWVLISQIEHAHLAGRLAELWGAGDFAQLVPREALLWAVFHHDDGWRDWDRAPDVDPQNGVPRQFTEMQIDDSLAIWSASIALARQAGPLEGYVVAGHFASLARRGAAWHQHDPAWEQAERFIAENEDAARQALVEWHSENPAQNTEQVARRALELLQFFDALSLWFCCSEPEGPDEIETPGGPSLRIVPDDAENLAAQDLDAENLRISPWPFTAEVANFEVPGRSVPARAYADRSDLAAAPSQPVRLAWRLRHG
jgi:hypothetical protein